MEFRVKSGKHREGNKVYCSGDIVVSDRDLVKVFKNKFEPVLPGAKAEVVEPKAKVVEPKVIEPASVKVPLEKKPAPHRTINRKSTNIKV